MMTLSLSVDQAQKLKDEIDGLCLTKQARYSLDLELSEALEANLKIKEVTGENVKSINIEINYL